MRLEMWIKTFCAPSLIAFAELHAQEVVACFDFDANWKKNMEQVQVEQAPQASRFFDPPYVRNGPLLSVADCDQKDALALIGAGQARLEIQAIDQLDLRAFAKHLDLTWNFHDPLVDALKALVDSGDAGALEQARKVLDAIRAHEDN